MWIYLESGSLQDRFEILNKTAEVREGIKEKLDKEPTAVS